MVKLIDPHGGELCNLLVDGERLERLREEAVGLPSLLFAVQSGNAEQVDALVNQAGADVNAQSPAGQTILQMAIEREHLEVIQVLLTAGSSAGESIFWVGSCRPRPPDPRPRCFAAEESTHRLFRQALNTSRTELKKLRSPR